jgi:hypothetical protein
MAALKMFELAKLSIGKAAELAGMSKLDFIAACARYEVSVINIPADKLEGEMKRELDLAKSLANR